METNYQYRRNKDYNKTVSTKEHSRLRCLTKKALKRKHPQGDYDVVGAIGTGLENPAGQYMYGTEKNFYYATKQAGLRYRTLGYVEVGEGQYFAVMKKSKCLPVVLGLLAVLIVALVIGYYLKATGGIDRSAIDYTPPSHLNVETDENSIALPGYSEIYVEADTNMPNIALWNPAGNPCYFKFVLKQGEEVLFESGLVPPGKAVTDVELSKNIPQGMHELTIEIKSFSLEDKETALNGGLLECTLIGIEP